MPKLHDDEVFVDAELVRTLLRAQCPGWSDLPLRECGSGTDNTMYRLGENLLVRLPKTPGAARSVVKEQTWLPLIARHLDCAVPEPLHAGTATLAYPQAWSIYRWIDGVEAGPASVTDWSTFGTDLARSVRQLHEIDVPDLSGVDDLTWYRGGTLQDCADAMPPAFERCNGLVDQNVGIPALEHLWRDALSLPEPSAPAVWLHGDLKPSNLLVRDGRLQAMIDFGCLSVGYPDAEHATVWDLPSAARESYWHDSEITEPTWLQARAWAILVAVSGISYYWDTFPEFVAECSARLDHITSDSLTR